MKSHVILFINTNWSNIMLEVTFENLFKHGLQMNGILLIYVLNILFV